jgi:3-methyladenine DNA glycosylase AlkC
MSKHRQEEKQFSLKDLLFNDKKVKLLASEIKAVYPEFASHIFTRELLKGFKEQELMERIRAIRDALREYLPKEYSAAIAIILEALPPPLDDRKTDNDFGDFIYAPYSYFVATYGCTQKHVNLSLEALAEITKRFSAEGALRDFLNAFPKETLTAVDKWSRDKNYHVRRLASEGTRPNLPWAKKINTDPKLMVEVLTRLHQDKTRYVVRSVANHVNDLTKINPRVALSLLKSWKKAKTQTAKELDYLIRHALRSLIKEGNQEALSLIGFDSQAIKVSKFKLHQDQVKVGEALHFSFSVVSTASEPQNVLLDYVISFRKQNGKLAPKTFKIGKKILPAKDKIDITKKHSLKIMSTRTLYSGWHEITLQINGQSLGKKKFNLI